MKYYISILALLILCGCGGSDTNDPMEQNRNPGTFSITSSNITETSAILNWTSSIDPDGDVVSYEVKLSGTTVTNNLNQTTYSFNDLTNDTQYNGSVIAKDGNGGSTDIDFTFNTLEGQNNAIVNFNIPSELSSYYNDMTFYESSALLKDELATHVISKHTTFLSYFERHDYLYDADEDTDNTENVVLMYSGESRDEREYQSGSNSHSPQTFNTEHVYPRSKLSGTSEADLHHLRTCDISINSTRGNQSFAQGSGTYGNVSGGWYPGDDWRGDVARMIMYLNLRYDESFSDVGNLDLFLKWNREDPVSDIEKQRNNIIQAPQGNRNPFIDNPYLATLIWGGESAQNLW